MTLELAVASEDLADGTEVMKEQWCSSLDPEDAAAADMAIDLDAETTTCPACLTTFAPQIPMCPGCGLRFG